LAPTQGATPSEQPDKTMKTSLKLETGNNESLVRGIFRNENGGFTALTFSQSRRFKTYAGAVRWMAKFAA
jgi:hypothetical protein